MTRVFRPNRMVTSRARRGGPAWRLAWVSLAAAVAVLAGGCASDVPGSAVATIPTATTPSTTAATTPSTTATNTPSTTTTQTAVADWNPAHRSTVAADIREGAVTIHVGERLQFTTRESDTVNFDVQPADLHSITWYGSDLTFVGIKPGRTTLSIPNYDKHFDCPNGPCAHLNPPLSMTVTVLAAVAGAAAGPVIPAPVILTTPGRSRSLHLQVGQELDLPATVRVAIDSSDGAGFAVDGELCRLPDSAASMTTLVAAKPGTQMISLLPESADTSLTSTDLTILIDG